MVNPMVERATSNMLIGPDWAMNIEICDVCNQDPAQAKDIVKGIKKRLTSKNPKTQLLALTLLETIVKNCTEIIHMHVAEKELPRDMVKMVKKKPDFRVKEKILVLIDTWQEAFGGPRGRYPQFFAAYQELLRLGAVFPQRSESSAPVFTPLQTHPLKSLPQNLRNTESASDAAQSSAEAEFPSLSMEEIQHARGIMDVLAEMLNALDPGNKEGAKQETIVDLVEQCRSFKHRVVHLVNSTTDESLLSQGLALNDDLQRLLAKHESIASGTTSSPLEKTRPNSDQPLVNVDAPLIDTGDNQSDNGPAPTTALETQVLLPAPPVTNGQFTVPTNSNSKIDLMSWDGFDSPTESSLAIIPAEEPQPGGPVTSQQNTLAIMDMFTPGGSNQLSNSTGHAQTLSPHTLQQSNVQSPQASFNPNGSISDTYPPMGQQLYSQGPDSAWNGHITQQQQPPQPFSPIYGAESSTAFPPPPWEAQLDDTQSAPTEPHQLQPPYPSPNGFYLPGSDNMTNNQAGGMYMQSTTGGHTGTVNNETVGGLHQHHNLQPTGMYPQGIQSGQMGHMYPQHMNGNQMAGYGYGYGYQQNDQFLETGMSGLMVRDDNALKNLSRAIPTPSYVPPGKPSRPEDKLFGDLVDISKFKPGKTAAGRSGVM